MTIEILEIIGAAISGGFVTQVFNVWANRKKIQAEVDAANLENNKAKHELTVDKFDYFSKELDKYDHEYRELQDKFRHSTLELTEEITKLYRNNTEQITEKCKQIADLKSQIIYLK